MDDDGDMSDLYLTRKLAGAASPGGGNSVTAEGWVAPSPTIGSRISRGLSRASTLSTYMHGTDDIEELEMLLEVGHSNSSPHMLSTVLLCINSVPVVVFRLTSCR